MGARGRDWVVMGREAGVVLVNLGVKDVEGETRAPAKTLHR